MNPWLGRRVINFAHQGGSFEGPSSTLAAIEGAMAAGANAVELDVHATRDGVLVVCHDETVDRTTDGSGEIASLDLAEVRRLDNAYWFIPGDTVTPGRPPGDYPWRGRGPDDRRFGVATLDEVLASFPDVVVNLDIKRTDPDVVPYESALADLLRRHRASDRVIVASFHDVAIRRFREHAPGVATAAATDEALRWYGSIGSGEPWVPPAQVLQIPMDLGDQRVVTPDLVLAAHAHGLAVHVWTVNGESAMEEMLDANVDGVISDRPSRLAEVLERRGATWRSA